MQYDVALTCPRPSGRLANPILTTICHLSLLLRLVLPLLPGSGLPGCRLVYLYLVVRYGVCDGYGSFYGYGVDFLSL